MKLRETQTQDEGAPAATPGPIAAAVQQWMEPRDIKPELPAAPTVDTAALLPPLLSAFVEDESERMSASPDYVVTSLFVTMGSVIGTRCALQPKREDDWLVPASISGLLVGDPASCKTPAAGVAMHFVDQLESREAERYARAMVVHEAEARAHKVAEAVTRNRLKQLMAQQADEPQLNAAREALAMLTPPPVPRRHRYRTSDATVPKVVDIIHDSGGALLLYQDEAAGLLTELETPGAAPDRAFYLQALTGTTSYTEDRLTRSTRHIPILNVSILGCSHPESMQRHLGHIIERQRNDGLVQRLQAMVFPEPRTYKWVDRPPRPGVRDGIGHMFQRLVSLDPVQDGATPADEFRRMPSFRFDEEAQAFAADWIVDLHSRRVPGERNLLLRQHLAKSERLLCSLSLMLHLCDGRLGPVQLDSVEKAAAWCTYFEGHARRVYALVESGRLAAARLLAQRLQAGKLNANGFTVRDVIRKGWSGLQSSRQVEAALGALEDHGWVASIDTDDGTPGRPTVRYLVSPRVQELRG